MLSEQIIYEFVSKIHNIKLLNICGSNPVWTTKRD